MKSFRNLIVIASVLLLAFTACESRTEAISIPQLQKQLRKDSIALQDLQVRYHTPLDKDFRWCDSMLPYIPQEQAEDCFETLNLTQAYLSQFEQMLPVMKRDLAYIKHQLICLQNDIDTHYVSDSLAQLYLQDEAASADTLHYRIEYFQDRLSQQGKALQSLKKTIRKASKK